MYVAGDLNDTDLSHGHDITVSGAEVIKRFTKGPPGVMPS